MIKKIGGFLGEHVEKIVLIIVGLLCFWVVITRVLLTPNMVEYNRVPYSPGDIDIQILADAREKEKGKGESDLPEIKLPDNRNYVELLKNPLGDIVDNDFAIFSRPGKPEVVDEQIYDEPQIARVRIQDIEIEYIRSVVYEPVTELTLADTYDDADSEPNDLDFVTIAAYLDIEQIVDEFERCYYEGDPCLAKPIFASVNVQRQRLDENGSWGDWENVQRAKNDFNRSLFRYIDSFDDLPIGGMPVYKYQLNNTIKQLELLQPEPYQIATAGEEWLPPEFRKDLSEAKLKDKRESSDKESTRTTTSSTRTTGRRSSRNTLNTGGIGGTTTSTNRRGRSTSRRGDDYTTTRSGRGSSNTQTGTTNRTGSNELNVDLVYEEFQDYVLTNKDDLTKVKEPILFWAYDDSVEPGNTYRYRVRVGVLNPTAKKEGDTIIYWTSFSDITQEIFVHGKMYFFATKAQEAVKTASISVYKLHLGKWYKHVYDRVGQGETIGSIEEVELEESDDRLTTEYETVDFTTGAVMVDVVRSSGLASIGSTNTVPYYDMLYTFDGEEILHMPVSRTPRSDIFPKYLYDGYIYVQSNINKDVEPLESWGQSPIQIQEIREGKSYTRRSRR